MSEADTIIDVFWMAKRLEREKSGCDPIVCVAGWLSHAALSGALKAKYEGALTRMVEASESDAPLQYECVKIYPSHSFEEGFYFGSKELP